MPLIHGEMEDAHQTLYWQEGHIGHVTPEETEKEVRINLYIMWKIYNTYSYL